MPCDIADEGTGGHSLQVRQLRRSEGERIAGGESAERSTTFPEKLSQAWTPALNDSKLHQNRNYKIYNDDSNHKSYSRSLVIFLLHFKGFAEEWKMSIYSRLIVLSNGDGTYYEATSCIAIVVTSPQSSPA